MNFPKSDMTALAKVRIKCKIIGRSVIRVASATNDGSNAVRSEDAYAIYET